MNMVPEPLDSICGRMDRNSQGYDLEKAASELSQMSSEPKAKYLYALFQYLG